MILFLIWNNSGHMNESSKGRRLGIVMKNHHLCCRVWDLSMKHAFFRVVDFVLLANNKFTFKRKVKVKIYLADKFDFVTMGFFICSLLPCQLL